MNDPESRPDSISAKQWRLIAAKRRIEFRYAKDDMEPAERMDGESEAELRERIRHALKGLPPDKQFQMNRDKQTEHKQILAEYED